jgi:hypothetical protein
MEKEIERNIEHNGIGLLKNLILELTSREISILQIAQDNTGVITLNNNDCLWIEQLSRASLENEEYFPRLETPKNFNFLYVQSYIIRSYLLLCRINHRHIAQKYQFYIPRKVHITTTENNDPIFNELPNPEFEDEWNHLKEMNLDKLYNGYNFLRRIIDLLKSSSDDSSKINLFTFIQSNDNQNELSQQFEKYQIKDFPLIHLNYVCQLYEKSINHFQHSFITISQSLRIPIDPNLNEQLDQIFDTAFNPSDENQDKEKLQFSIRRITDFLNDLKGIEDQLLNQSTQLLTQTCEYLSIENPILQLIPADVKCQNYVPLGIKLIEIRSKLQEKTIHIEEKDTKLWNEKFDIQDSEQQNIFQIFKKQNLDFLLPLPESSSPIANPVSSTSNLIGDDKETDRLLMDFDDFSPALEKPLATRDFLGKLDYTSLFELNIRSVLITPSTLFKKILQSTEIPSTPMAALRFPITHANGTMEKYLCKIENLSEQFKKIFEEKKYDFDQFVIIDQNQLFVNFMNENQATSKPYISSEYRIIEKTLLIPIILEFQEKQMKYLVTKETQISSIINRFIIDQAFNFTSSNIFLGFFDALGKYIEEDNSINNIYRPNDTSRIKIIQYDNTQNKLCEVILRPKEGIDISH